MSSPVALQAMFDRFAARFVLPLVEGGEVLVSYPLGPGAMEHFAFAEPTDPDLAPAIVRARTAVLRELVLDPAVGPLEPEELSLLAALHNLLLAAHEDLSAGFRGGARWRHALGWALEQLAAVRPCDSAGAALARHSLLHHVPELRRRDTILRSRLGVRRYLGQAPPPMALAWPRLRRLRASEHVAELPELVPGEEARRALTALLEQSPLTCLLAMPYGDQAHRTELRLAPPVLSVLGDPELCRAVTYRHLELGLARVGPSLARAVRAGLERVASAVQGSSAVALAAFGLRYVVNLQATHCWTARRDEDLAAPFDDPWAPAAAEERRLFFGWAAAALARADRIGAPSPGAPELERRQQRYQALAAAAAGDALEEAARQVDWLVPPEARALPAIRVNIGG